MNGRKMLYTLSLRPRFFRASTPDQRLRTLFHELRHIFIAFDGVLDPARRHLVLSRKAFDREIAPLFDAYRATAPRWELDTLAMAGEVTFPMWLNGPPGSYRIGITRRAHKSVYTEKDLYMGTVEVLTNSKPHNSC